MAKKKYMASGKKIVEAGIPLDDNPLEGHIETVEPQVDLKVSKGQSDDDIIAEAKEYFELVLKAEGDQRNEELDDIRFCGMLEQWPAELKAIRESDPSGARLCLVTDKINQYKNQIVNEIRKNRPGIKIRPVDDVADPEVAEVLQGIIRHIEDTSKADIAYDFAADCSVTNGLGFVRVATEYVGDSFQQEIKIKRVTNRFSVYTIFKEPDGSDQKKCLVSELVNRKEFERQYPDCNTESWNFATGDSNWLSPEDIRVAEYFRLKTKTEKLYLLNDGNSIFADEYAEKYGEDKSMVYRERTGERTTVEWFKLTAYEILERTVIPGKFIPIVPCVGVETFIDNRKNLRGIVRGGKDACRLYNYQRSTVAELLSLHAKAPYIGAVGQFKTEGAAWETANVVSYAYLQYDPVSTDGHPEPPPRRAEFAGVPAGLLQDMQTSEHDIQASLGMYQASIGQDSNAKSGRALNAQANQGDTATFHFQDNHAKMIRQVGRIILGMIPTVYDTKSVLRTLGEDGTVDYAKNNPEQLPAVNKIQNENGAIEKIFNLGVGTYDVSVTVGQSFTTKRQEGAEFLTQLVQSSPESMQIVGDLLFKAMDMPYADLAAERFKKMLPPQLQEQDDGSSPEVQQIKMQAGQQIEQLTQQLEQAHQAMMEADNEAKQHVQKIEQLSAQLMQEKIAAQQQQLKAAEQLFALTQQAQQAIDKANQTIHDNEIQTQIKLAENDIKTKVKLAEIQKSMHESKEMESCESEEGDTSNEELQAIQSNMAELIVGIQEALVQLAAPKTIQMTAPSGNVYTGVVN